MRKRHMMRDMDMTECGRDIRVVSHIEIADNDTPAASVCGGCRRILEAREYRRKYGGVDWRYM